MAIRSGFRINVAAVTALLLLAACGGGGYSGDTKPSTPPIADAAGLDRFLLFPNPQAAPKTSNDPQTYQTNTLAYAEAYYKAIDPHNERDTLDKWKAVNKFDQPDGIQVTTVFGDRRDLGYGRRMTARYDTTTHNIAFFVENYVVNPGEAYGYSRLSLDAAIAQDTRWRIGINAIEFSPGPNGVRFAKFFNFNSKTGARDLKVNLDFRGDKYMPGPCVTCHGGRGDALVNGALQVVQNTASKTEGDVQAHLAPLEIDSLDFLSETHKAEQQLALKMMNMMVRCTYPSASSETCAELPGATRPPSGPNDWTATAAAKLIADAYAQDPNKYREPLISVDSDWVKSGQTTLYSDVVVPYCRMCHMLRGTGQESSINFDTYADFAGYADRIKIHVFDRGNMPLAKLVYDDFWASNAPEVLATFLKSQQEIPEVLREPVSGKIVVPGTRPIADPGPDRVVKPGALTLSAEGSLFATNYSWSLVSGPPSGVSLGEPNSARPVFSATLEGVYTLELIASNATASSIPAKLTLKVDNAAPAAAPSFNDIKAELSNQGCASAGCHRQDSNATPVFWDIADSQTVLSRVNFTDVIASPLLRKPSGQHHNAGARGDFNLSTRLSDLTCLADCVDKRSSYDLILNWILKQRLTSPN